MNKVKQLFNFLSMVMVTLFIVSPSVLGMEGNNYNNYNNFPNKEPLDAGYEEYAQLEAQLQAEKYKNKNLLTMIIVNKNTNKILEIKSFISGSESPFSNLQAVNGYWKTVLSEYPKDFSVVQKYFYLKYNVLLPDDKETICTESAAIDYALSNSKKEDIKIMLISRFPACKGCQIFIKQFQDSSKEKNISIEFNKQIPSTVNYVNQEIKNQKNKVIHNEYVKDYYRKQENNKKAKDEKIKSLTKEINDLENNETKYLTNKKYKKTLLEEANSAHDLDQKIAKLTSIRDQLKNKLGKINNNKEDNIINSDNTMPDDDFNSINENQGSIITNKEEKVNEEEYFGDEKKSLNKKQKEKQKEKEKKKKLKEEKAKKDKEDEDLLNSILK